MDSHSQWSEVLLEWVEECALVEGVSFSLEETDINGFFRNFQLIHKNAQQSGTEASLLVFLKEHYPNFIPQTKDHDVLCPSEYIYVYSMLLHFACVRHPETVFHDICKRLSPRIQGYIVSFFKELIDCTALDRQQLRHAIGTVVDKLSPDDEAQGSSKSFPLRTQTSEMLDKRTKELYSLRAELETERYEKDLLEMQNNQYEKKVQSLVKDNEKLQHDVQNLRSESLAKSLEFSSLLRTENEQIKKQQQLEISRKEKELKELREIIEDMKEEKTLLQEKLKNDEKNINMCMLRIGELERKVDEDTAELEQKDNTIKSLEENKQELEQIIKSVKESKQELDQIIQEKNEIIFSNCPKSHNSGYIPENLGSSVVDVLLREKEEELADLKETIQIIILMFKTQLPQDCNLAIAVGNLDDTEEEENSSSPSECLTHLMECVNRFSSDYQEEKCKVECLSAQVKSKQRLNEELGEKLLDFENEAVLLRDRIKQIEKLNFELEQSKNSKHQNVEEHISHCEMQIMKLKDQLENRDSEIVTLRSRNEKLLNESKILQHKIEVMQQEVEASSCGETEMVQKEKYEKLRVQHEAAEREKQEMTDRIEAMRNNIATKEFEIIKIGAENFQVQSKNVKLQKDIDTLKIVFQREKHNSYLAISKLDEHIRQMANEHTNLEDTLRKLVTDSERTKSELSESKANFSGIMATAGSLSKILFGEQSIDLLSKFPDIVANVKILQEEKRDLETKLKLHTYTNLDITTHSQKIEKELESIKEVKKNVELNLKKQLEESESEVISLRNQLKIKEGSVKETQKQLAEEMEALLRFKSDEYAKNVKEMRLEHEHALKTMKGDLHLAKDQIEKKEFELQTTIRESSELKKKLTDEHTEYVNQMRIAHVDALRKLEIDLQLAKALIRNKDFEFLAVTCANSEVRRKLDNGMNRLEIVERNYRELKTKLMIKLQQREERIEEILVENKQVHEKIDTFKRAYEVVSENFGEAETAIKLLSRELLDEVENKAKMNAQLLETGHKLKALLKDQSDIIYSQTVKLTILKIQSDNQTKTINDLQKDLTETVKERDSWIKMATSYKVQFQHEQREKSAIQSSLEEAIHDMVKSETQCVEFRASSELCTELQRNNQPLNRGGRSGRSNEILQEKYEESQQGPDAMQVIEERINELEDELEKMKEKMLCSGKME